MKKIISVIVAAVMLASMIPAVVLADEVEYVSPGKIIVPYTSGEGVTIDGVLAQGEWSETNKIALNETNMVYWVGGEEGNTLGPIDFYYSWGDKGLYMAAVVSDEDIEDGTGSASGSLATRFQIALNPQQMIYEDYAGLFFSIVPVVEEGSEPVLELHKHNYETQADGGGPLVEAEDGYEGAFTFTKDGETVIGWSLECIIPWKLIASEDRYGDLDEEETLEDLSSFNPKNEDVTKAYLTATIAYVKCLEHGTQTPAAARTCTDGVVTWDSASYDVFLLLCPPGATERTLDVTPFVAAAPATSEGDTSAEDPGTTEADPDTTPDDTNTTKADDTQTTTEEEGKTTTAEPAATTNKPAEQGKKSNTGLIIGIGAGVVVVAAAAACGIILSKKKKK